MCEIKCKKCGSENKVKNGFVRSKQRYYCKDCHCQFTDTKPRGKPAELKKMAVILYAYCGVSLNKIAKMSGVSGTAVSNWVLEASEKAPTLNPKSDSSIVIIDEMWHFVNGKNNKIWLWRAIDGKTRRPLAWVLGNRDASTLKKLIDIVDDGKCAFITDEYAPYFEHIPEDRHYYGKDLTFPVEQSNSDIRHWLGRFVRRSKCTSRSVAALTSCIALMLRTFNHQKFS
jgi:IS1 family transposase/transposase-like protein